MTSTTHQMIAITCALALLTLYPVSLGPLLGTIAVVAVMIGALTPDLDQPTANIWRRLLGGNVVGNVFQVFSGGHRHFTHSLAGIFGIGLLLRWAAQHLVHPTYIQDALTLWSAFMVGYISHPLADTLTDRGVPWLWPLRFNFRLPPGPEEMRVTTDSFVERILVRSAVVVVAVLLLQRHWLLVKQLFTS